jgi:hypothetical protein
VIDIDVVCAAAGDGWLCTVRVRGEEGAAEHEVPVRPAEAQAHGIRNVDDAEQLVRETFAVSRP